MHSDAAADVHFVSGIYVCRPYLSCVWWLFSIHALFSFSPGLQDASRLLDLLTKTYQEVASQHKSGSPSKEDVRGVTLPAVITRVKSWHSATPEQTPAPFGGVFQRDNNYNETGFFLF